MAVMGVRISWLMLARNSLLARLAASAASLATWSSAVRSTTRSSNSSRACLQGVAALLDLVEHGVEAVVENAQLVAAGSSTRTE